MSKKQKSLAVLASVFLMLFTIAPVSNAMHIKEFPYDRYRSWSNLIWTMCNKYFRYHRINLPGNLTCTWWINNIRS